MQTYDPRERSQSAARAILRLARGTSPQASWILSGARRPQTVTIGSGTSCDWQIDAPHVAPHALSVALIDGSLFVSSGPGRAAMVDGAPLPEAWKRVEDAMFIDLGSAQIELVWEPAAAEPSSERDRVTLPDGVAGNAPFREATRPSWAERFSQSSLLDTPTLLGRVTQPFSSAQLLRYTGLALFTALAYRAWLVLLDRF